MLGRCSSALIATCLARNRSTSVSLFATASFVEKLFTSRPWTSTRCLNSPVTSFPPRMVTRAMLSAVSCWS